MPDMDHLVTDEAAAAVNIATHNPIDLLLAAWASRTGEYWSTQSKSQVRLIFFFSSRRRHTRFDCEVQTCALPIFDLERADRVLVVGGREHDHRSRRDALDDLEAAEARHVDVEEQDVDGFRGDRGEAVDRIGGAADDLDAPGGLQQAGEALERPRLAVDSESAEQGAPAHASPGRGWGTAPRGPPSRRPT